MFPITDPKQRQNIYKITKAQRLMEKPMLHRKLLHRKRKECIRKKTKLRDVRKEVANLKWKFTGHNVR